MFDDVKNTSPNPLAAPPVTPPLPPTPPLGPSVLPTSQPNIPPQDPQHASKPSSGFASMANNQTGSLVQPAVLGDSDKQLMAMLRRETLSAWQKILVIAAIVLIIGAFTVGGIFLFFNLEPFNEDANRSGSALTNTTDSKNTNSTDTSDVPLYELDTDEDKLRDIDEKKFGTDINLADTDSDGLSDYDEVKVYMTDPLNADTDGDGYVDGREEVDKGYDPKGPGKLQ